MGRPAHTRTEGAEWREEVRDRLTGIYGAEYADEVLVEMDRDLAAVGVSGADKDRRDFYELIATARVEQRRVKERRQP